LGGFLLSYTRRRSGVKWNRSRASSENWQLTWAPESAPRGTSFGTGRIVRRVLRFRSRGRRRRQRRGWDASDAQV